MICDEKLFSDKRSLKQYINVGMPDGTMRAVKEVGTMVLGPQFILKDVLYIPEFKHNLLSIGRLMEQNKLRTIFTENRCLFQDLSEDRVSGEGIKHRGIYNLKIMNKELNSDQLSMSRDFCKCNNASLNNKEQDSYLLYQRLGHTSMSKLKHVFGFKCKGIDKSSCDTCCFAKHHKLPFPVSKSITDEKFSLLHIDLWGPYRTKTITGETYFLTILDDHTRVTWTHLVSNKGQVYQMIQKFIAYVENQSNVKVKMVRSDNGTEIVR
ncbi:Retrovirus-related Pol polyprotein from transposon TNT 1-94 [Bienertia sinuspersici]